MVKVKAKAKVEVKVKLKVMVIVFDTKIRFAKTFVKIRPAGASEKVIFQKVKVKVIFKVKVKVKEGQGQCEGHGPWHSDKVSRKFGQDPTSRGFTISYFPEGQGHDQGQGQGQSQG